MDRRDPETRYWDVWLHDLAHGRASRFTSNSQTNNFPIWSPDGNHIVFQSIRDGVFHLYKKATSGALQEEGLDKTASSKQPLDWSRDGRYIIEEILDAPGTRNDIWVLPLFGDQKRFPYLQTSFNEHWAKLSPNGQWLAYVSDETKRNEVYVEAFPTRGRKWPISIDGGDRPVWSPDGKELFFIGADRRMMAVEVKNSSRFEAGAPKPLFDTRLAAPTSFDVAKDGRFLIPIVVDQAASVPMTVVVNWQEELKRLVPSK